MNLYRVRVETEIMVVADTNKAAIEVAKANAADEITNYGKYTAIQVKKADEIPDDWRTVIPYAPQGMPESKKCSELVPNSGGNLKDELQKEEIEHIVKSQSAKGTSKDQIQVRPETRPDPKPKEMDWHDTKSGRPITKLRFVR